MSVVAPSRRRWLWPTLALLALIVVIALGVSGWIWRHQLEPVAERLGVAWWDEESEHGSHASHDAHQGEASREPPDADEHDAHDDEPPGTHAGEPKPDHRHTEADALKLGKQAQKNIGVRLTKVALGSFDRTVTIPGIVVERPGWTTLEVTAPMTGVVARIYPIQGQAAEPGRPLFEVRLTHEDLLLKQTEFLRNLEERDVIGQEVARLEKVVGEGVVAGKTLLERKYEQQKQNASFRAQHQALLLHGLSKQQIAEIEKSRTLLQSLTVSAPIRTTDNSGTSDAKLYRVQEIKVSQGSYVSAGATLCRLVDHSVLYVEGRAFDQDVRAINEATAGRHPVSAIFGAKSGGNSEAVKGLQILYLDDKVDPESRTFRFFVTLPNRVLREDVGPDGRRFLYWKFTPGTRVQIQVPLETWSNRIVLPAEAVAQDGADYYVFEVNGDHFDRRAVHVQYRDADSVVIANDEALKPGVMVAASAAHQMQMALKNKSGGAVDPHAGHNH